MHHAICPEWAICLMLAAMYTVGVLTAMFVKRSAR